MCVSAANIAKDKRSGSRQQNKRSFPFAVCETDTVFQKLSTSTTQDVPDGTNTQELTHGLLFPTECQSTREVGVGGVLRDQSVFQAEQGELHKQEKTTVPNSTVPNAASAPERLADSAEICTIPSGGDEATGNIGVFYRRNFQVHHTHNAYPWQQFYQLLPVQTAFLGLDEIQKALQTRDAPESSQHQG